MRVLPAALALVALAACAQGRVLTQDATSGGGEVEFDGVKVAVPAGKAAAKPPDVPTGPSGLQAEGTAAVPSDADADANKLGARMLGAPPDVATSGGQQGDDTGLGGSGGAQVASASAVASAPGARVASSTNLADTFNAGQGGSVEARVTGIPGWGGANNGPGSAPVRWLNALTYVVPRRYNPSFMSQFTGRGSKQLVTIVLENWEAKIQSWGPDPVYRAPTVAFTWEFGLYEWMWYASNTGTWGWKAPQPMIVNMKDQWGNTLAVKVRVTINLRTWEVYNVHVYDYRFSGNNWGPTNGGGGGWGQNNGGGGQNNGGNWGGWRPGGK